MTAHIIQTLMGAIGSVGFAALFNVRGKRLILFFLGGALNWAIYLICIENGSSMFVGLLCATMMAAITSEVFARIIRAPVLILLVPLLIPLIPGGDLYRSMDGLIRGDTERFLFYGSNAITSAGAICLGIIGTTAITHIILRVRDHFRKSK